MLCPALVSQLIHCFQPNHYLKAKLWSPPVERSPCASSAPQTFTLGFFSPTNISKNRYVGIWYHNLPIQTIVWVANRQHPMAQSSTGVLTLCTNGTLIITSMQHNSTTILWSSAPTSMILNNPVAQLLDDGNFVVRDKDQANHVAWQSFDHPTDTLFPGMKLVCDLTTGLNRNLTSWKSPNNPSPVDYSITMDIRGDPQLVFHAARFATGGRVHGPAFPFVVFQKWFPTRESVSTSTLLTTTGRYTTATICRTGQS